MKIIKIMTFLILLSQVCLSKVIVSFNKSNIAKDNRAITYNKDLYLTNNGRIIASGTSSTKTNTGIISFDGSFGMLALDGAYIVNEKGGIISNHGDTGMEARGKDSEAINYGRIYNNGNPGIEAYGKDSKARNYGIVQNHRVLGMNADNETTAKL